MSFHFFLCETQTEMGFFS